MNRGPAVGAVDERVAVAAVAGVEQLGQALARRSRCRARPGPRARRALALAPISKPRSPRRLLPPRSRPARPRPAAAPRPGRRSRKRSTASAGPSTSSSDAALVVEDAAAEAQLGGEAVDVGPEADPLHGALDAGPDPAAAARPAPCSTGLRRRRPDQLDQLAQRVVGARLRLLDAGDVLGAGDDARGRRGPRRRPGRRRSRPSRPSPSRAGAPPASARIMFAELPLVESASSVSPGRP